VTHPWLAGCYFGVLMGLFYAAWVVIFAGAEMLYVAVLGGLVSWPLFAVGVKLRWGQRPDAKDHPRAHLSEKVDPSVPMRFSFGSCGRGSLQSSFIVPALLTGNWSNRHWSRRTRRSPRDHSQHMDGTQASEATRLARVHDVVFDGKRLPRVQYGRSTLCSWLARSSFGRHNQVTLEPSQR
jgi:hypothetical protein